MKKILLASTILVGSAGVAAADVSFSGEAFLGIDSTDGGATWGPRATASMSVAMSGETDGGLMFGADFDITAGGYSSGTIVSAGVGDATVWISGDFGKVSLAADTGSPAEVTLGYEGTFGNFGIEANYEMIALGWDVTLSYDFGDYDVYVTVDDTSTIGMGGSATFGDFNLGLDISDISSISTTWELSAGWSSGAVSIDASIDAASAWTLSGAYDLGGGASVEASFDNTGVYSLGVAMEF